MGLPAAPFRPPSLMAPLTLSLQVWAVGGNHPRAAASLLLLLLVAAVLLMVLAGLAAAAVAAEAVLLARAGWSWAERGRVRMRQARSWRIRLVGK